MPHFMIVLIPYVNLLNLSWIKNVFLRNNEPLNTVICACFRALLFKHMADYHSFNVGQPDNLGESEWLY